MTTQDLSIAREILYQLQFGRGDDGRLGKLLMFCWGVQGLSAEPHSLEFRVSGRKIRGKVRIELMPDDTYTVTITPVERKALVYNDVYFDQLVSLIDNLVERGEPNAEESNEIEKEEFDG